MTARFVDSAIRVGFAVVAVVLAALIAAAAANPARAQTADGDGTQWLSQPAPREWVAEQLVIRNLHVPAEDLDGGCYDDRDRFTRTGYGAHREAFACYVRLLGFMEGTARRGPTGKPLFDPDGTLTRGQAASVLWRLATQERVVLPAHAAVFIDVSRRSVHEPAIRYGAFHGLIVGVRVPDGQAARFEPDAPVTRRQWLRMLQRVEDHWRAGD